MFALSFFAFLAVASAAPQFGVYDFPNENEFFHRPSHRHHDSLEQFFNEDIFDTRRFWTEMAEEMQKVDQMLSEFAKHFPTTTSETGIQGNEYVVTITLNGFEEKDIKVKAREGVLMVQAVHKSDDSNERSYLDLKTLPSNVNVNGTWTFEPPVLKIVFPLLSKPEVETETEATEVLTTQRPKTENREVEEMEPQNGNVNHDADVGLERGDRDKNIEILTNNIPDTKVEATTYAVDLNNDVEFVPVKY